MVPAVNVPSKTRPTGLRWSLVALIGIAALATVASAQRLGLESRRLAGPVASPPLAWRTVPDAGAAFEAWRAAGVRGRRLVVFSGRWSSVPPGEVVEPDFPATYRRLAPHALDIGATVRPDTALLLAAYSGVARALTTVMPPAAVAARAEATRATPGQVSRPGLISSPASGFQRWIVSCDLPPPGPWPSGEPVLVLVEPSYLGATGCPEVEAWLAARGLASDLAVVALQDPAADQAQRALAAAMGDRRGAGGPRGSP